MSTSNVEDDSWRFADEAARKVHREVGIYGGDLVPRAQVKSVTGTARGEELFHRPELYRPWRTPVSQSHAEVVVSKEQEIEALTRKCTDLRSNLATANRDLQRCQAQLKNEVSRLSEEKDVKIETLQKEVDSLRNTLDTNKADSEHHQRVLKMEHETETRDLHGKMKAVQEQANELGATYFKQMQEVKAAAAREVELIQQLCNARTAELSNELQASNDALRKLQSRNNGVVDDLQDEMAKREDRCMKQLGEQEKRFDKMRDTLQVERQTVETQRDKALQELSRARDQVRVVTEQLSETERRYKDWNVRVLSDLDQLYNYYKSVVDTVLEPEKKDAPGFVPKKVADVYLPAGREQDGKMKDTMDAIVERLQQMTVLKQQNSEAMNHMMKKSQTLEATIANSQEDYRRQTEDRDTRLARLHTEVGEAKSRQDRLEAALAEVQGMISTSQTSLANSSLKLQFFADDLNSSLASSGGAVQPPRGKRIALVATTLSGAVTLWEKEPLAMRAAIQMLNDAMRIKMREYGGYECASDGDSLMIAFQDAASAIRFCCETQVWVLQLNWSKDILEHHIAREETAVNAEGHNQIVFRGLRVGMALHWGEVDEQVTPLPTGVAQTRVQYFGRTVLQLLHIASFAAPGQVVASAYLWDQVRDDVSVLGSHVQMKDLGEQRLSLAQRSDSKERTYSSTENMTLIQLSHSTLASRRFTRESTTMDQKKLGPVGIVYHMSPFRRLSIETEIQALRSQHLLVSKGVEVTVQEMESVGSMVTALGCKLRDAQINGKMYSQTDIVAHVAALDRVVSRTELIKGDVSRLENSQRELQALVKSMEDILIVHTKVSMTEDEFKKRIEMVQERASEKIHEASLQNDHKIQQLRNSTSKIEHTNQELRQQLASASVQNTEAKLAEEKKKNHEALEAANKEIKELRASVTKLQSATKFDKVPRVGGTSKENPSPQVQDVPTKSSSSPMQRSSSVAKRRPTSATGLRSSTGSSGYRSKLNEKIRASTANTKEPLKVKPVNPEFKN